MIVIFLIIVKLFVVYILWACLFWLDPYEVLFTLTYFLSFPYEGILVVFRQFLVASVNIDFFIVLKLVIKYPLCVEVKALILICLADYAKLRSFFLEGRVSHLYLVDSFVLEF